MKVTIRKMKRRDIPGVQAVAKESWHSTYDGIIPITIQEKFLSDAYHTKVLKKQRRKCDYFVAIADDKLIGFANFTKRFLQESVHLHALYLLPAYQGKGIGTWLLETGIKKLGAKEISLHVERQNKQALQFYERKGFVKVSEFESELAGYTLHMIRMVLKVQAKK